MSAASRIDILLRLVPDAPSRVRFALDETPNIASQKDANGYSLVHAAASYGHVDLLRALVETYKVDVNIADDDGETALFYTESLPVARCLVEELGANVLWNNGEGLTAVEKIREDGEGDWVGSVVIYLEGKGGSSTATQFNGTGEPSQQASDSPVIDRPPMVPQNVQVNIGTMPELPEAEGADPEIRRKIQELAAKGELDSPEAQAELRALVTEVVTGMHDDAIDSARDTQRRRIDD